MKRSLSILCAAGLVGSLLLTNNVSATVVDPVTKACLDKTVGSKAANAIIAAKKLTTKQKAQVAKCKSAASSGSTSGSTASGGSTSSSASLVALTYGLVSTVIAKSDGFGNISDPALVQLADGSIRMFFLNGNETQAGITGFDNLVHSYISSNNGATWSAESGVRFNTRAPVSVAAAPSGGYEGWSWSRSMSAGDTLTHFTSSDGKDFTLAGGNIPAISGCKGKSGTAATNLGDPQIAKTATGYIAYAHDAGFSNSPPFQRHVCGFTSPDGINWTLDATKTVAYSYDIATNAEVYKNRSGTFELILPIDNADSSGRKQGMSLMTSTDNGATWSAVSEISFSAADPERLDIANGDSLLAFGNFDHRSGGLLAVTKKISSSYKASRTSVGQTGVEWLVSGASKADIIVKNLCLNSVVTSSATFTTSGSDTKITFTDTTTPGCVYILVGSQQAIH